MNRSRSSRETVYDLELRLAPPCLFKGEIILIEDDDDDDDDDDVMQIYPPGPPAEAFRISSFSNLQDDAVRENDLELRLGVGAPHLYPGNSNYEASRFGVKFKDANAWKYGKASCSHYDPDVVKLRCTICMDTMKEETSTICGHVFCKSCITNAILFQRRCPTCRGRLSLSNIHRIYLPGSSS